MDRIDQKIFAVDVVDINVVGIGPTYRPTLREAEPIATELETRLAAYDYRMAHFEGVFMAEVRVELSVRNPTVLDRAVFDSRFSRLSRFSMFCGTGIFIFLRGVCSLGSIRVLGRLVLFGRLSLLVMGRRLCVLGRLGFLLGLGRGLSIFGRLRFFLGRGLSAFSRLGILRVFFLERLGGRGSTEDQKQNRCAENCTDASKSFHQRASVRVFEYLPTRLENVGQLASLASPAI